FSCLLFHRVNIRSRHPLALDVELLCAFPLAFHLDFRIAILTFDVGPAFGMCCWCRISSFGIHALVLDHSIQILQYTLLKLRVTQLHLKHIFSGFVLQDDVTMPMQCTLSLLFAHTKVSKD